MSSAKQQDCVFLGQPSSNRKPRYSRSSQSEHCPSCSPASTGREHKAYRWAGLLRVTLASRARLARSQKQKANKRPQFAAAALCRLTSLFPLESVRLQSATRLPRLQQEAQVLRVTVNNTLQARLPGQNNGEDWIARLGAPSFSCPLGPPAR